MRVQGMKAKNRRMVVMEGEVPEDMEEMVHLPDISVVRVVAVVAAAGVVVRNQAMVRQGVMVGQQQLVTNQKPPRRFRVYKRDDFVMKSTEFGSNFMSVLIDSYFQFRPMLLPIFMV